MSDAYLRLKTVMAMTGIPRSSLYRMISEGRFPRQVALSHRSVGWRRSAVQRWIDDPTGFREDD
ncbi:helix-turn-helix transcriptional regulator [Novosphingobium malaysiense]|uniref:helix-turn-helix transcriptional regulator n=1 Tax=Novosphingobium malaysiense TaxID=1348853 RepID=UPI0009DCA9F1|nr:AlpA family phage regulatory protein [Novosphingobium malaysiense]